MEDIVEEYVQKAFEIVKEQATVRNMTEEEISSMVKSLSESTKTAAEKGDNSHATSAQQEPLLILRKAIREQSVICLECGKKFKLLTKKHLATHDLTPEQYK